MTRAQGKLSKEGREIRKIMAKNRNEGKDNEEESDEDDLSEETLASLGIVKKTPEIVSPVAEDKRGIKRSAPTPEPVAATTPASKKVTRSFSH